MKLDHLGADTIRKRLPSVEEIGHNFANVDITREPIPVVPTIHYQMGGIPTNINGQVVVNVNGEDKPINGLYAVGECSCVSVHGANRLGTNSLLDLLVFGKAAGDHIIANNKPGTQPKPLPAGATDATQARLARLDNNQNGEYAQDVANDMRAIMQTHAGVFRSQESMDEGVKKINALRERVGKIGLKDNSKVFNTARIEALEVENLMEAAQATMTSAAARKECRGAHLVRDYEHDVTHPTCPLGRNDAEWMKHTLWYSQGNALAYKPVRTKPLTAETVPPKPRTF
jgi:succinate dehydrogenase / fumarate reductase flavoprotein subunit